VTRKKKIEIWFQDEARIGQKNGHVRQWARRGTRPIQPADQRYENAYLFGASIRLQTEQQAIAYVRGMALELKRASGTLLKAAETLKAAGKVNAANQTYLAHKALQAKASEVLSG